MPSISPDGFSALCWVSSPLSRFACGASRRKPIETWSFSVAPEGASSNSLFRLFLELPSSATGGGRSRHLRIPSTARVTNVANEVRSLFRCLPSRLMGSVRSVGFHLLSRDSPAGLPAANRLKHGRSASHLKVLPRTPCFGSSSNSLHPPPAAVVLVTFESPQPHG